jgi:hypothetical protein
MNGMAATLMVGSLLWDIDISGAKKHCKFIRRKRAGIRTYATLIE